MLAGGEKEGRGYFVDESRGGQLLRRGVRGIVLAGVGVVEGGEGLGGN